MGREINTEITHESRKASRGARIRVEGRRRVPSYRTPLGLLARVIWPGHLIRVPSHPSCQLHLNECSTLVFRRDPVTLLRCFVADR